MARNKCLTWTCSTCELCIINEKGDPTCTWGKNPKIMFPPKGKFKKTCNLIKPTVPPFVKMK